MSSFSEKNIASALGERDVLVTVYSECDSTNLRAIEYAREHGTRDAIFLADSQTAGRGRLGRSFISPCGRGIYLSILTGRLPEGEDAVSVTAYAAVAVCRAIEKLTTLKPSIKWVNDIYIGGKKVAGILTQGVIDPERGTLCGAVMGVGVNVLGAELDPAIDSIATTLEREGDAPDRETLATLIVTEFLDNLYKVGTPERAEEYRQRSHLIGKSINVIRTDSTYPATVLGITDRCELILRKSDGTTEILATGEVSVRESGKSQ